MILLKFFYFLKIIPSLSMECLIDIAVDYPENDLKISFVYNLLVSQKL